MNELKIDLQDPAFYADWSEEDLRAHIKKLNEILGQKIGIRPIPKKAELSRILDPNSEDFLGMGISMREFIVGGYIRDIQSNIIFQTSEERRRRMDIIVELSAELAKIQEQTRFATSLARGVIEDVIKGDWNGLHIMADYFTFNEEHESLREREGRIYARFAELCKKAFAERPGAEEVAELPKN